MARKKEAQDDAWAKNLHEWCGDIEGATGYAVRIVMTPTKRAGVFKTRVELCKVEGDRLVGVVAAQSSLWPNEKASSLYATLYQLAVAVDAVMAQMIASEDAAAG